MKTQWKITEAANHWRIDDGESPVCDVIRGVDGKDNAALIASAPRMRKVLEDIYLEGIYLGHLTPEQADEIIAVLAEAKGE